MSILYITHTDSCIMQNAHKGTLRTNSAPSKRKACKFQIPIIQIELSLPNLLNLQLFYVQHCMESLNNSEMRRC